MPSPHKKCWRINPDPALEHAVESMARRENRSTSQMLFLLIRESVANRRTVDTNVERVARIIRGEAADFSPS
jgi:hypothetical protein